jgi:hypothetical protein
MQGRFLGHVNEEVRLGFLIGFLKIAIGAHALETGLLEQLAHVVLADRAQVERVFGTVVEGVFETHQPFVDMLRLGRHPIPAIVVFVLRRETVIEDRIVVALVEDEDAVMLERGVEFRQRATAIALLMHVGERVAEADDGVVLALDVAVQPPPVGLDRLEHQSPRLAVRERLGQHLARAVGAGDVEAGLGQPHGVKAGAGRDVEDGLLAAGAQHVDEELALALGPAFPVDQLVPLLDEALDVFADIFVGLAHGERIVAIILNVVGWAAAA